MNILFVGGTGIISHACVKEALEVGHDVWTLNRGRSALVNHVGSRNLIGDAADEERVGEILDAHRFDVVIQWTAYVPEHVQRDIRLYRDVAQYVFISSASAYQKPPLHWLVTEKTPRENPYWQYSRDKIACEKILLEAYEATQFPATIVRPSLTYGVSQIPVALGSWQKPFTIVERMRRGAKILVPGDGTSIWTLTHNSDLARGLLGLLGHPLAIGEDFHITSDEALTWNQIYQLVARAAGVHADLLHVPSDAVVAADSSMLGTLWGDKSNSAVFDNSKLRRLVPNFASRVPFEQGIGDTVRWFDEDPSRQAIDHRANQLWDHLAAIYLDALERSAHWK